VPETGSDLAAQVIDGLAVAARQEAPVAPLDLAPGPVKEPRSMAPCASKGMQRGHDLVLGDTEVRARTAADTGPSALKRALSTSVRAASRFHCTWAYSDAGLRHPLSGE
jgi:hypothetical protein